jgi:hypothetical protein
MEKFKGTFDFSSLILERENRIQFLNSEIEKLEKELESLNHVSKMLNDQLPTQLSEDIKYDQAQILPKLDINPMRNEKTSSSQNVHSQASNVEHQASRPDWLEPYTIYRFNAPVKAAILYVMEYLQVANLQVIYENCNKSLGLKNKSTTKDSVATLLRDLTKQGVIHKGGDGAYRRTDRPINFIPEFSMVPF